jgi:hypothetical protein
MYGWIDVYMYMMDYECVKNSLLEIYIYDRKRRRYVYDRIEKEIGSEFGYLDLS